MPHCWNSHVAAHFGVPLTVNCLEGYALLDCIGLVNKNDINRLKCFMLITDVLVENQVKVYTKRDGSLTVISVGVNLGICIHKDLLIVHYRMYS